MDTTDPYTYAEQLRSDGIDDDGITVVDAFHERRQSHDPTFSTDTVHVEIQTSKYGGYTYPLVEHARDHGFEVFDIVPSDAEDDFDAKYRFMPANDE